MPKETKSFEFVNSDLLNRFSKTMPYLKIKYILQFNSGDVTKPIMSDDGNTLSLLVGSESAAGFASGAVFTNVDIRDRTNLLITGSVEVPNRANNVLFEGKAGAMWSVSQDRINLINNQNIFQPFVATAYSHNLYRTETMINSSTLFGNTNFIGVTTYNGMSTFSGAIYSPNFKASFSNETEVVRVRITCVRIRVIILCLIPIPMARMMDSMMDRIKGKEGRGGRDDRGHPLNNKNGIP